MLTIDIRIPTYLPDKTHLRRCILSVMEQTYINWSLTLVDGSPCDSSFSVSDLKDIEHGRVNYIRNPNQPSIATNWNFALNSSQTRYTMLLHQDDYLEPNFLEEMTRFIITNPNGYMYFSDANIVDSKDTKIYSPVDMAKLLFKPRGDSILLQREHGLAQLLKGCFIICPTIIYDLSRIPKMPFDINKKMVLDLDLYARVLLANGSIYGLNKKLFNYRRHPKSQTYRLNQNLERFREEIALYDSIASRCSSLEWAECESVAKRKVIIKLHILYRLGQSLTLLRVRNIFSMLTVLMQKK